MKDPHSMKKTIKIPHSIKHTIKLIGFSIAIASIALSSYGQAAVARWNLGEQDPGAANGMPGDSLTIDDLGTNALGASGSPVYTNNAAPNTGSSLAVVFDGGSVYQGSAVGNNAGIDALYSTLDWHNISLSCDVYMFAPGSAGFSFPVSMGSDSLGGIAPVEVGGYWYLIHIGVQNAGPGPAIITNAWTHLDLVRTTFGSSVISVLYINGVASITNTTTPIIPTDFFTIGGNELGADIPDGVEGYVNAIIDNVVITNRDIGAPPSLTGMTAAPATIYASNSIILTATGASGDPKSQNFAWLFNGVVITNTTAPTVAIINVTTNQSGSYNVVYTNAYGAVTSPPVSITVLPSGGADLALWRMGANDPGAVADGPGDTNTIDALGSLPLTAFGEPSYSTNVPPGSSDPLSMSFDGSSYYQGTTNVMSNFFNTLNFKDFSVSCDIYLTDEPAAGFSFPISFGDNASAGLSILEQGLEWQLLDQGLARSATTFPVTLNQWTHLEMQYRPFGGVEQQRLFINGADANISITANPNLPPVPIFTIGANSKDGINVEGGIIGQVANVVIHDYSIGAAPQVGSLTATSLNIIMSGASFSLYGAGVTGQLPLNYSWQRNGVTLTNTGASPAVTFNNVTASQSGSYDVVVTNAVGAVTSSVVVITVLPPGVSDGTTVAQYDLGDADPGAVAGNPGNATTKDSIGTNDLTSFGDPSYSSNVPPGTSNTLSMLFDGASIYQATGAGITNLVSGVDWNNFSLSLDVYMTAAGAQGFSFPVSIGGGGGNAGGVTVVEIGGKWELIHNSVQETSAGPVIPLNTWQHLDVVRENVAGTLLTRLFIDGADSGLSISPNPLPTTAFITIGGGQNSGSTTTAINGIEGLFNGNVANVVLQSFNLIRPSLSLSISGGVATLQCMGRPGASIMLLRTPSLSPAS